MPNIRFEVREGTGILFFDRPQAMNALSSAMIEEAQAFFDGLDAGSLDALLLTGTGKAFIAGADIKEMAAMGRAEAVAFSEMGNRLMASIEACPVPVIAVLNGHAMGGGLEVALAADFIYASTAAKLGLPEVTLGLMPGFGGVRRLCARVGAARARELVFTGRLLTPQAALERGIVNRLFQGDGLMAAALETAALIGAGGRRAVRAAKLQARAVLAGHPATAGRLAAATEEAERFGALLEGAEAREGMTAFLEKRRPRWTAQDGSK